MPVNPKAYNSSLERHKKWSVVESPAVGWQTEATERGLSAGRLVFASAVLMGLPEGCLDLGNVPVPVPCWGGSSLHQFLPLAGFGSLECHLFGTGR